MFEVTHNLSHTPRNEDPSQSLKQQKTHLISCHSTEDHLTARYRTATSKRLLQKMRLSRGAVRTRQCPPNPMGITKSLNVPDLSFRDDDGDPKRSKDEKMSIDEYAERDISPISKSMMGSTHSNQRHKMRNPRRVLNQTSPLRSESFENCSSKPLIVCDVSKIPVPYLKTLLRCEPNYHPSNSFLYYVDPIAEDKVDAVLRNEAVHNLRFLHNAFFTLSAETFCKAVSLIDRFIGKVKVKPKYMSCVAAAAYYVAAKLVEPALDLGIPTPDTLVRISRCGGTATDLIRMEDILTSKLGGDLGGVNAFDFLRLFATTAIVLPESLGANTNAKPNVDACEEGRGVQLSPTGNRLLTGQPLLPSHSLREKSGTNKSATSLSGNTNSQSRQMYDLWGAMTGRVMVALCSLEIYAFRPVTVALAVLYHFHVTGVDALACLCDTLLDDVQRCSVLVEELYEAFHWEYHLSSRKALVWILSKRTFLRIGCSSPTPLDTISEETDKEDNLQFIFEP